jgi:hypothetical protein
MFQTDSRYQDFPNIICHWKSNFRRLEQPKIQQNLCSQSEQVLFEPQVIFCILRENIFFKISAVFPIVHSVN